MAEQSGQKVLQKRPRSLTVDELLHEIQNSRFSEEDYKSLLKAIEEITEEKEVEGITKKLVDEANKLMKKLSKEREELQANQPDDSDEDEDDDEEEKKEEVQDRINALHAYDRILDLMENSVIEHASTEKDVLVYDRYEGDMHYKIFYNFTLVYKDKPFTFEFIWEYSSYGYGRSDTSRITNPDGGDEKWETVLSAWDLTDTNTEEHFVVLIDTLFKRISYLSCPQGSINYFEALNR